MTDLIVNEIFHSIQGESTHVGRPCVFIRLTGCNLRCTYCDTPYAFFEGRSMSIEEILGQVDGYRCTLVEVTGGEPLLQDGVDDLFRALCDRDHEVLVETGGSLDISQVDPRVKRIVDFKCPGSGMERNNRWVNVAHLTASDEVKFVITDRADFDWSVDKIREHSLEGRCPLLMSVAFGMLDPVHLAEWIIGSGMQIRMQLQMHKYVWEPTARGV